MKLNKRSAIAAASAVVASIFCATAALSATVYDATSAATDEWAKYGGGHSLVLAGQVYNFDTPGVFTDNGATASLTGTVDNGKAGADAAGYIVTLNFTSFTSNCPADVAGATGCPKKELKDTAYSDLGGPVDTSTWKFWDLVEEGALISTLVGTGANADLSFDIISKPAVNMKDRYVFQSGFGANGKNIDFGLSGWLYLIPTGASSSLCQVPTSDPGNQVCDFNLTLQAVPLPAPAFLLIGGLAGLVAVRSRARR